MFNLDVKKSFSDATKILLKDGAKDTAVKVIPIVATGIATVAVSIINKDKDK